MANCMADARKGGVLHGERRLISAVEEEDHAKDHVMIEILMIAQMARNPLQAIARRWYCHGLFRATRGRRRCAECTAS